MPAVMIYVPFGRFTKKGVVGLPKYYLGALQQVEALKQVLGPETEVVGEIHMYPPDDTPETDMAVADRFVKLIRAGKPAIAMIRAMDQQKAYWMLVNTVSPGMWVPNPRQLAIIEASPLPQTDEEWRQSLERTVRVVLKKVEPKQVAPAPARP